MQSDQFARTGLTTGALPRRPVAFETRNRNPGSALGGVTGDYPHGVGMAIRLGLGRSGHRAITYDEQVGRGEAKPLTEDLAESEPRPNLNTVVGPSGMRPIRALKGTSCLDLTVLGLPGYSTEPAKAQ